MSIYKQKIGMSVNNNYSIPTTEVVKLLAKTGFDAVSPNWEPGVDIEAICNTAKECGLYIQSFHAPYRGATAMWSEDKTVSAPAIAQLKECIEDCKKHGVPLAVLHTWIGFNYTASPTNAGLENYKEIVDIAAKYGIKIAFENTEGDEFLAALMEYFKDDETVGFCWDSGHELCYSRSEDLLKLYGDRLYMTHLNDNLGVKDFLGKITNNDDLHLLPFDGIADWDYNVERLKKSKKIEYLNFELKINCNDGRLENMVYMQMPIELYFTECFKRACKIAYKYSK